VFVLGRPFPLVSVPPESPRANSGFKASRQGTRRDAIIARTNARSKSNQYFPRAGCGRDEAPNPSAPLSSPGLSGVRLSATRKPLRTDSPRGTAVLLVRRARSSLSPRLGSQSCSSANPGTGPTAPRRTAGRIAPILPAESRGLDAAPGQTMAPEHSARAPLPAPRRGGAPVLVTPPCAASPTSASPLFEMRLGTPLRAIRCADA